MAGPAERLRTRRSDSAAAGRRGDGGFTILEVLVVLTIIAIAMAVMPSLLTGINSARLRAAALDFVAALREVRGHASTSQAQVDVLLDLQRLRYSLSTAPETFRPLPAVVDSIAVAPERLVTGGSRVARLRFLPDGSATGARISLHNGNLSYTVEINGLTGAVWRDG
ncbi:Tfp pilus assembly protein FimT/FimU [Marinibaculum pumilum]|uniref:Type II secretion system protein H n=1 Tax=Marinibaculum pumilum TaxID=1766165 RepID=A0ABV7L0R2_9PROT